MNRLDTNLQNQSFAIVTDPLVDMVPAHRFLVLIPTDADYSTVAHRIWELAHDAGASVEFLGLCRDAAQEPGLRRELVTLAALVYDGRIATEIKIETGMNWLSTVRSNYQPGDVIVCFAEQRAGILHKSLSQILQAKLNVPVYILSGLQPQKSNWVSQVLAWVGSLAIIAGGFLLQIRITALPKDWAQTTLLILLVIVEFWLVGSWNSLFN